MANISGQGLDANGIWIDVPYKPRLTISAAEFLEANTRMPGNRAEKRLATRLEMIIAIETFFGRVNIPREEIDIDYNQDTGAPTLLTTFYPGA